MGLQVIDGVGGTSARNDFTKRLHECGFGNDARNPDGVSVRYRTRHSTIRRACAKANGTAACDLQNASEISYMQPRRCPTTKTLAVAYASP